MERAPVARGLRPATLAPIRAIEPDAPALDLRDVLHAAPTTAHGDEAQHEAGFMTPHGPHLDSWFSQATNTINLWMALGRVIPGNGIVFFPAEARGGV